MKNGAASRTAPFFFASLPSSRRRPGGEATPPPKPDTRRTGNAQRQIFKRLVGLVGEAERIDRALLLLSGTQTVSKLAIGLGRNRHHLCSGERVSRRF